MEEILSLFWRWNFPFGMLLFQTVMCIPYGRRKYFIFRWMAFTIMIFIVSITMTHDWEWQGSIIRGWNILSNMPARILIMILIAIQMFICYKISLWTSVFFTTLAITLHSIHFSLFKIIEALTIGSVVNEKPGLDSLLIDAAVLITFLVVAGFIFNKKGIISIDEYGTGKRVIAISLIILVATDFLNLFQFANDPYSNYGMTLVVGRLYDICFNAVTFYMIYNLVVKYNMKIEQEKMEALIKQRQQQFTFSQQIIDSINIKSHDLKKQIRYLEQNEFDRKEILQGLKDVLSGYDTIIEANDEALSTILSEKSLYCHNNKIKFLIYANDVSLESIKPIDIYTIFANLLDNAIEASLQVEEEHRNISVIVKQKENLLSIHIENVFAGEINMKDGILYTMKSDPGNHGFGFKSIQQIVDRYKGNISFRIKKNIFIVNILIPVQNGNEKVENYA